MKSRKFLDYLPLLILVLAQLYTLYIINTTTTVVNNYKLYIGIAAVIVCFVAMIINPRIGKWATVATLLAGLLDLINFLPFRWTWGFTINDIGPDFQAFSFCMLILFTILNINSLKRHLRWLLLRESEDPETE